MTRFFLTAAALSAALVAGAHFAQAQEFKGKCTDLKTQDTCVASGACRWMTRKPVSVNGKDLDPSSCAFKPGVKAALAAAEKK